MIKVKRMGRGDMIPPRPFVRDLKLINPRYSIIWEPIGQRWAIISPAPVNVFRRGYVYEYLVESSNKRYAPLDARVIKEIKRLKWEKNRMRDLDDHLKNQKRKQEEEVFKANIQTQAKFREFGKKLEKFRTSKTFS